MFFPKTSAFHLLMLSFNNSYFQFTDALLQTQAYQIQMFSQYRCFPIKDAIQMLVFLKDYRHMIDCTRTMNRGFEIWLCLVIELQLYPLHYPVFMVGWYTIWVIHGIYGYVYDNLDLEQLIYFPAKIGTTLHTTLETSTKHRHLSTKPLSPNEKVQTSSTQN